jgi:leucyl/phenylalanyl-tRNA--protein transferase
MTSSDGLRGFGPAELLDCYARGVFPMAETRDSPDIFLVDPELRGVIPLEDFHLPRRLARSVRNAPYEIRINTAFAELVRLCAEPAPDRDETWINAHIERLYADLHRLGHAHSVECWHDDRLVGGLYGVSLRGAFFGESMVSRARDASKIALVHLVARLKAGGFSLLDTQFTTRHLEQFGVEEISRDAYRARLLRALEGDGDLHSQVSLSPMDILTIIKGK